jgi:predicted Rossmann fold flavoprotein
VTPTDITIVGAGAAGLVTAIAARRVNPARPVRLLDSAPRPGAKILVSGGGRCNVTNRVVTERDFWGGRRTIVKRVLEAFTAADTVDFFDELAVPLQEEYDGKLFPVSGRARDVLDALVRTADSAGVELRAGCRVEGIERVDGGFDVATARNRFRTQSLVLATGGQSLPKSGSDGAGFGFARHLGHTIVATTPALVPLLLDEAHESSIHRELQGVAHGVGIAVWVDGRVSKRLTGSMLWTHFGISGPVALNASRHWLRAQIDGREAHLTASFCPGDTWDALERWWTAAIAKRPRAAVLTVLSARMPSALAAAVLGRFGIDSTRTLAHLTREDRRAVTGALLEWPLKITDHRGWNYAEATAGGVALDEIDPSTMASRVCPGLYLVGEILDVDGRIGGFNFQWAWSTAHVAGRALAQST